MRSETHVHTQACAALSNCAGKWGGTGGVSDVARVNVLRSRWDTRTRLHLYE